MSDVRFPPPVVLLGLGNTCLGDDAAGIAVARRVWSLLPPHSRVVVKESARAGFDLLELLAGYHEAVIVDADRSGESPRGSVRVFRSPRDVHTARLVSFHDVALADALELGRLMGLQMPGVTTVYTIRTGATDRFTVGLSAEIRTAVHRCAAMVLERLVYSVTPAGAVPAPSRPDMHAPVEQPAHTEVS